MSRKKSTVHSCNVLYLKTRKILEIQRAAGKMADVCEKEVFSMMVKLPRNKKVIIIVCLVFCLAAVGINRYMQSWRTMDVILFMGQSNMSGACGDASLAPELIEGAGYEYRAITDPDTIHVLEEPFGLNEHREGALDDRELLERNGSMVTAFVNAYYEQTKTPVVAISASRGSSSMNTWLNRGLMADAIERLDSAKECLKRERVHIRHIYMVWLQGEADANKETESEEYQIMVQTLVDSMQEQGVEHCFLIQIGQNGANPGLHDEIMQAQLELCEKSENITLVSELPASLTGEEYMDGGVVHFLQEALNLIGTDAGTNAGAWVEALKEAEQE